MAGAHHARHGRHSHGDRNVPKLKQIFLELSSLVLIKAEAAAIVWTHVVKADVLASPFVFMYLLLTVVAKKDWKYECLQWLLVMVGITGASSFLSLVIWFSKSLAMTVC